jgi:Helix-turn-helix domain
MRQDFKTKNQRSRILALLIAARGGWVSLPEILQLRIAQYNVRVHELRALGFSIENRRAAQQSFFRLVQASRAPAIETAAPTDSLFPDMAERHWDLG